MRQSDKIIVGITGGSGSGKSHLCSILKSRGYDVIDTDKVARQVMEKGEACLLETVREFGDEILKDGELNRKKLAEIVFSDKIKLKKLNEISHKFILARVEDMIAEAVSKIVFVEGAVLIESGFECDFMIGVLADYEVRMKRIILRDDLSYKEAQRRLLAQQKDSFFEENCDFIVWNNEGDFDIDNIIKRIDI